MSDLAELLKEHYDNHPAMEVRDAIKFIYQSHMGPGHLISDERAALDRLAEEWDRLPADPSSPLSEPLGNGLCRLSLSACKGIKLSIKTLNRLFVLTARKTVLDRAGLEQDLELLQALPFFQESSKRYLAQYRAQGCPALRHSKTYRDAYSPAYRVILQYYVNQIPLLAAVDQLLTQGQPVLVAIDGPCASGKSTLGTALAEIYRCPLLHMDDFFLLPQDRTPERLAQPGENVDHERFDREVLSPLCRGQTAVYRPWQCRSGCFGPAVPVEPGPLTVVEGSYSLHPSLRDRYQLRVWVEAPWEVRRTRLERRDPGCVDRFLNLWVPLEDHYFQACHVKDCCQIHCSGQ